jgi:hypothetical protein
MNVYRRARTFAVAGIAAAAGACAQPPAQSGSPENGRRDAMIEAYTRPAIELMTPAMTPGAVLGIINLAKQEAAATMCEGFELDAARRDAAMSGLLDGLSSSAASGEGQSPRALAQTGHDIALGGELAVAAYDEAAYCANAAVLRDELAGSRLGVLTPAQ